MSTIITQLAMFPEVSSALRVINPSARYRIKLANILLKKYEIYIYEWICMKFGMKIHDKSAERELRYTQVSILVYRHHARRNIQRIKVDNNSTFLVVILHFEHVVARICSSCKNFAQSHAR